MQIGVFGGSFNPITNGHIEVAKLSSSYVDEIWFMPCYKHNHNKVLINGYDRLKMIRKAIEGFSNFHASDFELYYRISGGTLVLLEALYRIYPHYSFYYIIGQDNAETIETWKNYDKLISKHKFIVLKRVGSKDDKEWYKKPPHIFLNNSKTLPVSSTLAREQIKNGIKPSFINDDVYNIIVENKLYAQ